MQLSYVLLQALMVKPRWQTFMHKCAAYLVFQAQVLVLWGSTNLPMVMFLYLTKLLTRPLTLYLRSRTYTNFPNTVLNMQQ